MYVELHLHTSYSLLDGASQPGELVERALDLGYEALAITDHDSLSGAMEFAQACREVDIQPIIGSEITLADGSHLTLLAETRTGYGNLCRLITDSKHGFPPVGPLLDGEEVPDSPNSLATYAEGLILLTGCRESRIARLLDGRRVRDAATMLATYVEWFGEGNVYLELQHHMICGDTPRVGRMIRLSQHTGVPYVATGDVHYHERDRHYLQDVLVAIRTRTTLDGSHRARRANSGFYLQRPEEMVKRYANYPDAVANTQVIARRCASFDLTTDLDYTFPEFATNSDETSDDVLERVCREALVERYPVGSPLHERAVRQLTEELDLISRHKLAGFFLVYRDLLMMARDVADEIRGDVPAGRRFLPPGRGRGSAVSSIVCYLVGLSPIDPLKHELYVGRFLNDAMSSVPDIDIDFPREIRAKMIERVYETYGRDHTAMVAAFPTYRLPSAVRDIGKALGLPADDVDRIARLSEPRSAGALGEELARFPEYASRLNEPPWNQLIVLASQLARHPRHISQHSGGIIIASTPLNEMVPIQPAAMEGRYICQWDKDSVADARMIKIDFLALGMLSQVEECLELIEDNQGVEVDLSRIDHDDPAVYAMIQKGDTIGTFQIESRAQIQMVRRTKPQSLEDLVVQVAIVRPGPIIGGAVTPFVERRLNPNYIATYDHPSLEPVLKETLGVVLYQEQVIQVAEILAGFTPGQADQFRRAMSRKRSAEAMEQMRVQFMAGAAERGVSEDVAANVFKKLGGFAEYGFPKSHAAAFGLLAYQTAWLKHYFPAEFLAALLNNQPMGFYAPHVLINDGKRSGLRVLRPDINDSGSMCTVEGTRTIRIGLSLVRSVSEELAQAIVNERQGNGPYASLIDLFRRVPMPPPMIENLIGAGACDGFGLYRREMIWQIGLFIPPARFGSGRKGTKTSGQQISLPLPTEHDHVELPPTTAWERVNEAYRTLGFSLNQHPVGLLRHQLSSRMISSRDLETLPDGIYVQIPGLVVCRQRPETAHGITFMSIEDEHDLYNVIIYPNLYEEQRNIVRSASFVIVHGRVQRQDDNINIIATKLESIDMKVMRSRPGWSDDTDDRIDEVDVQTLEFESDPRLTRADILAVQPQAHNYR